MFAINTHKNPIWISWHKSQRTTSLCLKLGIHSAVLQLEGGLFSRHIMSALWSLYILATYRPTKVYLQYSYLLLVIIHIYKRVFVKKASVICDCHTKALRRTIKTKGLIKVLYSKIKKMSFKCVDICIISNSGQLKDARMYCSNIHVLPDPIPVIAAKTSLEAKKPYVVFVCSYDTDEPVYSICRATIELSKYINVYITGAAPTNIINHFSTDAPNVILTGFLPRNEYENLISGASCIISCTDEEGCLQSAGYEALALGVPYITSSKKSLVDYFGDCAIYVDNTKDGIINGVNQALDNIDIFKSNLARLRSTKKAEFDTSLLRLNKAVNLLE